MSARTTSPRTHVHVEYHVRKDVDLDELKREIARFVSGIHEHGIDHVYASYQDVKDERHFVHVGDFAAETVPGLQTEAFFGRFTGFLRERCRVGPEVTLLTKVASTR
jgi:hypothetical protein